MQTCFSQHLVLVEQQLAVLVVHFVWRRLKTTHRAQADVHFINILYTTGISENLLELLGGLLCLCCLGNTESFFVCVYVCVSAESHQLVVLHRWYKGRKQTGLIRSKPERKTLSSAAAVTNRDKTPLKEQLANK